MTKFLIMLVLLAFANASFAEGGCPPGQYPQEGQGWKSCVPIPGQAGGQDRQTAVRWADRWQALSTDTTKAVIGTATGLDSMDEAESAALRDCESNGGSHCKITASLANGCIGMSVGSSLLTAAYGTTKAEAEQSAVDKCTKGGDSKCSVYYSSCSYAERLN
jgi:hypothetical protein